MATLAKLAPYGKFQAFDNNGDPLNGGLLYTYETGTTTAKTTYTDSTKGTANANPVVLDSRGEANVWLDGIYKFVLKDSDSNTIWTVDGIDGEDTFTQLVVDALTFDGSTVTSTDDFIIKLGDAAGSNKVYVKDSASSTVATIDSDGNVVGVAGTFSGAVSGTTGTFSGAVSGTTGTFSSNIALSQDLHLLEESGNGTNYANLKGADSIVENSNYTFGDGNLSIAGTAAGPASITLYEDTDNGTNYIQFKAASSITENTTLTYGDGNINIPGTAATASSITLAEATGNGTNTISIKCPASVASNLTYVLPSSYSSGSQVLMGNGSGTLSWVTRLADVVDDTSPQLGADLDCNSFQIDLANKNLRGNTTGSLADDTAISFTPGNTIGLLLIGARAVTYTNASCVIAYRATATLMCQVVAQPSTLVSTGTLTLSGTTGTDGKLNIAAAGDGKIYIENRTGVSIDLNYVLLGE